MPPLFETPAPGKIYLTLETSGCRDWMPGPVLGYGGRWSGQTDGEILPAHVYHNEERRGRRLSLGLVLFRLVAPPL
jgi:hypothetical protein